MNLERIAKLANDHDADAHNALVAGGNYAAPRHITIAEHELIADLARAYLSAVQREDIRRAEFAARLAQGLVTAMAADPANLIIGPQIANTAVDMADCLLEALARPKVPI